VHAKTTLTVAFHRFDSVPVGTERRSITERVPDQRRSLQKDLVSFGLDNRRGLMLYGDSGREA
jgi:hypothetical protein